MKKLRFREIRKHAPNYAKLEPEWEAKSNSDAPVSSHECDP